MRALKHHAKETYEQYVARMEDMSENGKLFKINYWVFETVAGRKMDEEIFFQNERFIMIADGKWRSWKDINKLHLLSIVSDFGIRTVRDLTGDHIEELQLIKTKSLEIIKVRFKLNENDLRIFFHYLPTTYVLHIHFVTVYHTWERPQPNEILFNDVMIRLEEDPLYFRNILM